MTISCHSPRNEDFVQLSHILMKIGLTTSETPTPDYHELRPNKLGRQKPPTRYQPQGIGPQHPSPSKRQPRKETSAYLLSKRSIPKKRTLETRPHQAFVHGGTSGLLDRVATNLERRVSRHDQQLQTYRQATMKNLPIVFPPKTPKSQHTPQNRPVPKPDKRPVNPLTTPYLRRKLASPRTITPGIGIYPYLPMGLPPYNPRTAAPPMEDRENPMFVQTPPRSSRREACSQASITRTGRRPKR